MERKRVLRKVFDKTSTGREGGAIDAQLSPDGTMVGFESARMCPAVQRFGERLVNRYLVGADPLAAKEKCAPAVQITFDARGRGKMNGLADFVAQEEMDRYRGFWWGPNGKKIAYEQVDESHIPVYRILHQGKDSVGAGAQEDHRYPFAGAGNPKVKLGVVDVPDKLPTTLSDLSDEQDLSYPTVWMDLGSNEDIYLARVNGMCSGRLSAQIENRLQTELQLQTFDIETVGKRISFYKKPPILG